MNRAATKVGLMVVLGVAAMIMVYRFVDERAVGGGYTVFARFDDVQGLIPKSRVLVAGIPVGRINSIRLEGAQARVELEINKEIKLYDDASIAMKSLSLLGEQILVIQPGTPGRAVLRDGAEILQVQNQTTTEDVLDKVGRITDNVENVTNQMDRAFGNDEAGNQMAAALKDLSAVLGALNRTITANEQAINSTLQHVAQTSEEGLPKLVKILEHVESVTGNLETIVDSKKGDISRTAGELDDTVVAIREASERLTSVLENVDEVTGRAARGEGTLGRLSKDEALIDEVEGAAEGINEVVGGFGRLRTIVELRSEYNVLARGFKTYFSLRLEPREGRYFLIQVVDDPKGKVEHTQTVVQRSPAIPGEPGEYVETRTTRTDDFKFSLMMAKRVSIATFRFGIIESSGGLGMDLNLLQDRFELAQDLFDVDVGSAPRWRIRGSGELVQRLWVLAGVDEVLSNSERDYFFGLMLRFDDRDLKGLLPFAGGVRP